jgi:uncharacterized membrane protein
MTPGEFFDLAMGVLGFGYVLTLGGVLASAACELERPFIWSSRAFMGVLVVGAVDLAAFLIWQGVTS